MLSVFLLFLLPLSLWPSPHPLSHSFFLWSMNLSSTMGLMNISAQPLWREDKLSMHFLLINGFDGPLFIIWAPLFLNRCEVDEAAGLICTELIGNRLMEIKCYRFPPTSLVPVRRSGLYPSRKRTSYISFKCTFHSQSQLSAKKEILELRDFTWRKDVKSNGI